MLSLVCLAMAVQAPVLTMYGLSINVSGEVAERVVVNGFEVYEGAQKAGEVASSSVAVNDLIVNGENVVEMVIDAAGARVAKRAATPVKAVLRLETDSTTDGSDVTTALIKEAKFEGPAGSKLPHTVRFVVTVKTDNAPRAWTKGAKLQLSNALTDEVVARTREITGLIEKRAWDAYGDALAVQFEQTARFYPLRGTADEIRKGSVDSARAFFPSKEFAGFVPIDRAHVVCVLHAEGRAVECTRRGGGPLLQYMAAGDPMPMNKPLVFSRIDGHLVVVR